MKYGPIPSKTHLRESLRLFVCILFAVASVPLCPVDLMATENVQAIGHVVALEGDAVAVRAGQVDTALAVKSPVFMGDCIKTAANGKLQLLFTDDSLLGQGPNGEITLDEYIFDPADKEKCGMGMSIMKGVFRSVTGKITALNPERFKVKTRMATIGIRGCDVAFDVQPANENVFVFELTHDQDVIVSFNTPQTGGGNVDIPAVQPAAGQVVTVTPDGGLATRDMTQADVQNVVQGTTPGLSDQPGESSGQTQDSGAEDGESAAPAADDGGSAAPASDEGTSDDAGAVAPVSEETGTDAGGDPMPAPSDQPAGGEEDGAAAPLLLPDGDPFLSDVEPMSFDSEPVDGGLAIDGADPILSGGFESAALDPSVYESTLFVEDPLALPPPPPEEPPPPSEDPLPPPPTEDPLPPPPPPPPLDGYYPQGSGNNWEWGLWYVQGVLDDIDHSNFAPVGSQAAPLIAGTAINLTGTGPAGAIVEIGGTAVGYLNGQVSVNLSMGGGIGDCVLSFSLSDGVNSAVIGGTASIDGSGNLNMMYSDFTTYSFTWQGTTYTQSDLAMSTWLDGSLVGPGTGPTPVTGVVGGFDMVNTPANSPLLAGEYGADVNPIP